MDNPELDIVFISSATTIPQGVRSSERKCEIIILKYY